MEILGLEKVSLVDYNGKICATIFTGGCNFFCPFCHNSGIVKREYQTYSEKEIFDYLTSRRNVLDAVTVSGGEPTIQKDLKDFIIKLKNMGFLVKLDTNGTNPEVVKDLIENKLIDYIAIDVKNNFDDYAKIAGIKLVPIEKIKQTLEYLKASNFPYELRTTLVKEFHNENNIINLANDLKGYKTLYLQKFVDSGACITENLHEIDYNQAIVFKEILEQSLENVYLRGY